jgi:imidazoleglycerol phosphate dehydratase HisB
MTVTLNISNDAELRAYIKDCIKGQILSLVREEYLEVIKVELIRKLNIQDNRTFQRMTEIALKESLSDILRKDHNVTRYGDAFIKPIIEKLVNEAVSNRDWNKMVDDLAKQKVRQLIG